MKTRKGSIDSSDLELSSTAKTRNDVITEAEVVAVEIGDGGKPHTVRRKMHDIINGYPFEITVIVLVIIDCCIVFGLILIDVQMEYEHELPHHTETMLHILHYVSLGILSLFLVEVAMKIYVLRLDYIHHKLELLDAVIIIVSFVFDIVYTPTPDKKVGNVIAVELIMVLRLWRITRIVNGIVISATKKLHAEMDEDEEKRKVLETELEKWKEKYATLETEYGELETKYQLLETRHGECTTQSPKCNSF